MSNVIIYDKNSTPNKVIQYLLSVNTPDYDTRDDVLINPENIPDVPLKYLKVVSGQVLEMTQAEKDTQDASEAQLIFDTERDTMRSFGQTFIESRDPQNAVIRAILLELLNYVNNERTRFNALLSWLGTQAQLTNRLQLTNFQLNTTTPRQALTAIKERLAAGEADTIS